MAEKNILSEEQTSTPTINLHTNKVVAFQNPIEYARLKQLFFIQETQSGVNA
jgi:hypothetical protein